VAAIAERVEATMLAAMPVLLAAADTRAHPAVAGIKVHPAVVAMVGNKSRRGLPYLWE